MVEFLPLPNFKPMDAHMEFSNDIKIKKFYIKEPPKFAMPRYIPTDFNTVKRRINAVYDGIRIIKYPFVISNGVIHSIYYTWSMVYFEMTANYNELVSRKTEYNDLNLFANYFPDYLLLSDGRIIDKKTKIAVKPFRKRDTFYCKLKDPKGNYSLVNLTEAMFVNLFVNSHKMVGFSGFDIKSIDDNNPFEFANLYLLNQSAYQSRSVVRPFISKAFHYSKNIAIYNKF